EIRTGNRTALWGITLPEFWRGQSRLGRSDGRFLTPAVVYTRMRAALAECNVCQAAGWSPAEADSPFNACALRVGFFAKNDSSSGTLVQIPGPVCLHFTIF